MRLKPGTGRDFDLVLMDILMPGVDGYAVCRQLKKNPATADIPVIFVTSRHKAEDETQGFAVGAADYIVREMGPGIRPVMWDPCLGLTPTESTVAELILEEKFSTEIALILTVSEKTVAFHRGNIGKKLGIAGSKKSLLEAIRKKHFLIQSNNAHHL